MKDTKGRGESFRLIHSALTHFVGDMIGHLNENMEFETASGGQGFVVKRPDDAYDIFIGLERVYTAERDFFDLCNYEDDNDVIAMYKKLLIMDPEVLQFRSKTFYFKIKKSMEDLILGMTFAMEGTVRIRNYQVFYSEDNRYKVNLN